MSVFPEARACLGFAAPDRAAAAGRHRAGPAGAGRCRRDAAARRASALAGQAAVAAQRPRRRWQALKTEDGLCADTFVLAADTVVAVGRRILPKAETDRRGVELPAAAVRPLAPRLFRRLPDHAGRQAAPAAGRDARALQAAVARGDGKLSRLRRMARQGRRLRRPGARRHLRRQAGRLLHQRRRPAALRDGRRCWPARATGCISTGCQVGHELEACPDDKVTPLRPKRPCPECGKPSARETYPFCSKRCKDVDLNRWLRAPMSFRAATTRTRRTTTCRMKRSAAAW